MMHSKGKTMEIRKAMIVDDSESDQFLASNEIKRHDDNIEIMQAYDGVEALEMLAETDEKPDVIFLDINMPRMNGLEFLEEYSKLEDQSPVIAMLTSSNAQTDRERALKFDCVRDYFLKLLDESDMAKLKDL